MTIYQYIGIGFMIICIILSPGKNNGENCTISLKWLFFCSIAFVSSGAVGMVQKIHQNNTSYKTEMPALLLTCFLISSILSGLKLSLEHYRIKKSLNKLSWAAVILPMVTGWCFAFPHTINLFLSGKLPSVVFFPTINLCPMRLTMFYAVFGFSEKLSTKQWTGIIIGILSTLFVSGIF